MKNQRRNAPEKDIGGKDVYRYQGPQKSHHTKDINNKKTSHRKKINEKEK